MKTCFKCRRVLPLEEFYKHKGMSDGRLGKCKDCAKNDTKLYARTQNGKEVARKRNHTIRRKEWYLQFQRKQRAKFTEKNLARGRLNKAVYNGKIQKLPCQICNEPKSQGHHYDYKLPLDVIWLCVKHHKQAHGYLHY